MSQQADGSLLTAGTKVEVQTVAEPATWVEVKGVRDIGGAGAERSLVRATDLIDTVEKYGLGRKDGTEITLSLRAMFGENAEGQEFLRDAYDDGDTVTLKVTYPNTATRTFDALVRSWPEAVSDGEYLMIEASLKVTSDVTRVDPA